ncbi:hypothetical protein [Humibacter sp. RRB41]|uniref:hypothetical protein n=1 Tax=Humibacter sp. RRB41 TaxID=2919946 RepID=UPI001FAAF557|nr:hypothetical protein [Humibacter sp. RRB41]
MNTDRKHTPDTSADRPERSFPAALGCLVALLALEALALIAVVIWLGVLEAQATASDSVSGLALLLIGALCAVWLVLTAVAGARRRSWMRGSSITWHVIVLAIAIGCFTGVTAVPAAGWWLLVIALLGIGLVLVPSVTVATAREVAPYSEAQDDSEAKPGNGPRAD